MILLLQSPTFRVVNSSRMRHYFTARAPQLTRLCLGWTNYFWLIGAALPAIQYFVARRYPRGIFRYLFFPSIFGAAGQIPPATCWYLGQWVIVGLIFNYFIRRAYFGWWSKFSCLRYAVAEHG